MEYNRLIEKTNQKTFSYNKKIIPTTPVSEKYAPTSKLTDGLFGVSYDRNLSSNWIGEKGKDMEFILDLGKSKNINVVDMDFLQVVNPWTNTYLPQYVEYSVSEDGKTYTDTKKIKNPHSGNSNGRRLQSFRTDYNNAKARYIKVHAHSLHHTSSKRFSAKGNETPVTILTDEITVK